MKFSEVNKFEFAVNFRKVAKVFFSDAEECRQIVGQSHPHGSIFNPKPCTECQCNNGHLNCSIKDPVKDCPKLDCPLEEQTRDGEKCCQSCRADFCSRGHDCHPELAVCVNGLLNYTCHCREGFKGNGTTCEGILIDISLCDFQPKSRTQLYFFR